MTPETAIKSNRLPRPRGRRGRRDTGSVDHLVVTSRGRRLRSPNMSGMAYDRSLSVGEESVEILHPHWKTLVRPIALAFVVVAVLLAGEVLIPANKGAGIERLALAAVGIVLLMWWLTYPLLRWRTTVYELTTRRMGLRDRLLGCGTLIVESAGEHGELILTEIPHVERVSATLFQLVEDERLRDE